jgi:hypothetical protein
MLYQQGLHIGALVECLDAWVARFVTHEESLSHETVNACKLLSAAENPCPWHLATAIAQPFPCLIYAVPVFTGKSMTEHGCVQVSSYLPSCLFFSCICETAAYTFPS